LASNHQASQPVLRTTLIFSGQPNRLEDQAVVLRGESDPIAPQRTRSQRSCCRTSTDPSAP
jgi:hypothetical protein